MGYNIKYKAPTIKKEFPEIMREHRFLWNLKIHICSHMVKR
jgi:hypothetical protein